MNLDWKTAVKEALLRYSVRHATVQIDRTKFLAEEQKIIIESTASSGKTPSQTISRVLQELRDEGLLFFSSSGRYALRDRPLDISFEEVPDDILDDAISKGNLLFKDVDTSDIVAQARIRQGMGALRKATLANYQQTCALCDIRESPLLVTSHIARWADQSEARGFLVNTICFCSFHDRLFEEGFFSLDDELQIIRRPKIASKCITDWLTRSTSKFRRGPIEPSRVYLQAHRKRTGLD